MRGRLLHADASARTLAVARIWVFGMCLADLLREPTHELAAVPLEHLSRVGVLALVPSDWFAALYTASGLAALKAVTALLLVPCIAGVRPFRPIAITACLLLTVQFALLRSTGDVNHGELAMLYAAWVLALAPSADALAVWSRPSGRAPATYAAAMSLIAFLFCLTYAFTGGYRLAMGAPAIFLDDAGTWPVLRASLRPGPFDRAYGAEILASPAGSSAFPIVFAAVTLFEVLAPFCLVSARFRWLWLAWTVVFHLASWLTLQILFVHNLLLMPLLLLDVEWWLGRLPGGQGSRSRAGTAAAAATGSR